jgi:UDP-glucose 4-epimerase
VKLLVTGGAGYIGSVVATQLIDAGHEVVVLDNLDTGHADAVPNGARFVRASIVEAEEVLADGVEAVLHFAAKSLVGESVAAPEIYWRNNAVGSLALLDAMRRTGVRRIVFSSTAATYGEPNVSPITEDTPAVPINPYGQSKLAVDHMLTGEAAAHGLAAVSLRYFNVGGAFAGRGDRRPRAGGDLRHRLLHARRHRRPGLPARSGPRPGPPAGTGEGRCRRAPHLQPRYRDGLHGARGGRGLPHRDRAPDPRRGGGASSR